MRWNRLTLLCLFGPVLLASCSLFDGGAYSIPARSVAVDGETSDWGGVDPAVVDPSGDAAGVPGDDIVAVYLARDAKNLYVRVDVANPPPSDSLYLGALFDDDNVSEVGERFIHVDLPSACSVDKYIDQSFHHTVVTTGAVAVSPTGGSIELSVSLSALSPPHCCQFVVWTSINGPNPDGTEPVRVSF
jgi:hypothetical protein